MAAPDRAPQLAAEGLYVSLGGLPILRDVSLHVDAHEAVAILGGNGSGKTTLIRTLLGLTRFQRGSVTLFGTPVESFKDWARLGYVPQHSSLNVSNATVREIVESGRLAHRRPFQPFHRRDRQQIASALETVGLADRARWPFATLSGGQKQRVLIARALATQPELLVMDEPLAGVDLHSQAGLAALLASLRDSGLALAVVLHEQGPMAGVLDRSITLCDGRVTDAHDHHGATDCDPVPAGSHPVGWSDPFPGGDS